jgi:pyruvate formate lyase activating enzyme
MDAANVDLKGFTERFYRELSSATLANVLDTLVHVKHETDYWLEITNLIIPGENDDPRELAEMSRWIASELGPDVPVHFSAFHPELENARHAGHAPRDPRDRPPDCPGRRAELCLSGQCP